MKWTFNSLMLSAVLSSSSGQALMFSMQAVDTSSVWSSYQVYQPSVSNGVVIDTDNNVLDLRYNHCASTAFYQDRWFTVWNANTNAAEGQPGQLIYLSTSTNFVDWSQPIMVFSAASSSINPVGTNSLDEMFQWQPNLLETEGELWCLWSEYGQNTSLRGTYFSRLTSSTGTWENTKIPLPGESGSAIFPVIDGISWRAFPTQNPVELSSGRILAPVTVRDRYASFPDAEKRNAVIYTDNRGTTWNLSELIEFPAATNAQWEPTVYEMENGNVGMVARRIDKENLDPTNILIFAFSTDNGETWSDYETIPVETLSSRMHVLDTGNRYSMIYNDHRHGDIGGPNVDRYNLSLFTSLSGRAEDWMPGISLTHNLWGVAYPQMDEKDDDLFAAFSQGNSQSILTVRISPKPDPILHYVYPRHLVNTLPDVRGGMLSFDFRQLVKSKWNMTIGTGDFSLSAKIVPRYRGVLVDGRANSTGICVSLKQVGDELALSCNIGSYSSSPFTSTATIQPGKPAYVGLSLQNGNQLRLFINDSVEVFDIPNLINLNTDAPLFIGSIQLLNSSLYNYYGQIEELKAFDRTLTDSEHALLRTGETVTNELLTLNADTFAGSNFIMDPDERFEDTTYGDNTKRIRGQGSAAVEVQPCDLSNGDVVKLRFEYQTSSPSTNIVLCTLGDATNPLRVELLADGTIIARDTAGNSQPITTHQPQVYTPVELTVYSNFTQVSVNGATVRFDRSFNPARFFLGQGYLENRAPTTQTLLYKINSIETRVY